MDANAKEDAESRDYFTSQREARMQSQITDLIDALRHFSGCDECMEEHGSYPQSVSCYCKCHNGDTQRWPELRIDLHRKRLLEPQGWME